MAALKPSEKRLLLGLGGVLFLVANFWAWSVLDSSNKKAAVKEITLRASIKNLQLKQAMLPRAIKRDKVLSQYLKRYDSMNTREVYLSNFVQKAADDLGLKLTKQVPTKTEGLDEKEEADFIKSGYSAEVGGDRESVLAFVHQLHNPAEFRSVKYLKLDVRKSEQQDGRSELVCNFTIQKFWHPDSERLLAEAGVQPADSAPKETEAQPANSTPPETEQNGGSGVRPNGDASPATASKVEPPPGEASPATVRAEPANDSKPTVQ